MKKLKLTKDIINKLESHLLNGVYKGFIKNGYLDPRGKTESQIAKELYNLINELKPGNIDFTTDHTDNLLKEARRYKKIGNHCELACLLYATWVEHWLNNIIIIQCRKKSLNKKETTQIIRSSNFDSKLSWLLKLLDAKPINKNHKQSLLKLIESRNSYVHYKWNLSEANSFITTENNSIENSIQDIEKTIKYLNNYYKRNYLLNAKKLK